MTHILFLLLLFVCLKRVIIDVGICKNFRLLAWGLLILSYQFFSVLSASIVLVCVGIYKLSIFIVIFLNLINLLWRLRRLRLFLKLRRLRLFLLLRWLRLFLLYFLARGLVLRHISCLLLRIILIDYLLLYFDLY